MITNQSTSGNFLSSLTKTISRVNSLEVKKLNKPILTMMTLAVGVVLFINVQHADAELLTIEGKYDNQSVSVTLDGDKNILEITHLNGNSTEIHDSALKMYKTGAFSLKNSVEGVALWAHPFMDNNYRIILLVGNEVHRFVATTNFAPDTVKITEPTSSIGVDITKYDIPVENIKDRIRDARITVYFDPVSTILINDEYAPQVKIENQDYQKIPAHVSLDITRDGKTIKSISSNTTTGQWNPVINILDDSFTPSFCYTVTITAISGNYTDTVQDDFTVYSKAKYWDSTSTPIDADSKCNR